MKLDQSLQLNKTAGQYVFGKDLGQGTFGKVKEATHMISKEKVAIKILEKSKIIDGTDAQRVRREIEFLRTVRHPNIVQLYEIIETPKQLLLVMEYVSNGELFEHIVKRKRLREQEACQIFRQLLAGVEYMHSLGIVHRDLKPENLLIDFNQRIKIVDFGLSNRYLNPEESLKTACGSPCYAAPQMIAGKRYRGLSVDLWSCGIILFAMVAGHLPFEDQNTAALYKKIMNGDFTIPKYVSGSCRELINGILTVDPSLRMTLHQIKQHSWLNQSIPDKVSMNGIRVDLHKIPVEDEILTKMMDFSIDPSKIRTEVQANRHNSNTAFYYLLLKKMLKTGTPSPFDTCSPKFVGLELKKPEEQTSSVRKAEASPAAPRRMFQSRNAARTVNHDSPPKSKIEILELSSRYDREDLASRKGQSENIAQTDRPNVNALMTPAFNRRKLYPRKEAPSQHDETLSPEDVKLNPQSSTPKQKFRSKLFEKYVHTLPYRTHPPKERVAAVTSRYESLDEPRNLSSSAHQRANFSLMNRTFMGPIPGCQVPRWENDSERIRSILNTTISGGAKRANFRIIAF